MYENIYDYSDYRLVIKTYQKRIKQLKPHLSMRALSSKINIQYTYLSKALNHPNTHLNNDHIYELLGYLEFSQEEIDYVMLLKEYEVAENSKRKMNLKKKISQIQSSKVVRAEHEILTEKRVKYESEYLLDPYCTLVQIALSIDKYFKNPFALCSLFNIKRETLKSILRKLENVDILTLEDGGEKVLSLNVSRIHVGQDNPLMRTHQSQIKSLLESKFNVTPEDEKEGFLVTFVTDKEKFQEIRVEFQNFIKKVQKISESAKTENLCQLSFDFLMWS